MCQEGARNFWRTIADATSGADLAPVPEDQAPPSVGEQLAQALHETGVSQKELARRLAGTDDHKKVENKRRWLAKIARGELKRPGMVAVEQALSLPSGYFQFPTPAQVRRQQDRLEVVEGDLAKLRSDFDRFLRAASERRVEVEEDQELPTQQEDRPSSRDSES